MHQESFHFKIFLVSEILVNLLSTPWNTLGEKKTKQESCLQDHVCIQNT